ncbi:MULTISPECIES: DUF4389 domain-containing protein [unclassified Streptomyces]|uniref:DUF4389 domain-containing protein n=1 Tax=unclassified Streptomyces TaxID=2593676 RepID=UPI002DDC2829|nr:DUF4389 domain-containing protein [Streptomyces sp. NBC_01445]WSE06107.1 DUF4389 domain-containing protein [Streptomyces sp. NBC_01445]
MEPHYGTVPLVPGAEALPELDIPHPGRQNRLFVLVRLLLLLPHLVVLALLSVVAFFAVVAGWFAALLIGRLPDPVERYLAGFLGYDTRVNASAMLLTGRYPPFEFGEPMGYPVRVRVLRSVHLNRLAVLLRLLLVIPAALVGAIATAGWWAVSVLSWLVVLLLGRMPLPLFEATAAVLRYRMRLNAYLLLLTAAYPKRLFGDQSAPDAVVGTIAGPSATRPLFLGAGAKVLVGAFLVLGLVGGAANSARYGADGSAAVQASLPGF